MSSITPGAPQGRRWDLFCRVVDNLGDAGVMWRLARQLARERQCRVRLFIDQPAVLRRLVPTAAPGLISDGVLICPLEADAGAVAAGTQDKDHAEVVVTGFHGALPKAYRSRMAPRRPVWINLEYLSAEDWIESFHRLPSPQPDGLVEHYFYPGFTTGSGGLLREADLLARRDAFQRIPENRRRFLAQLGVQCKDGETLGSLLCYPSAPLVELAQRLATGARALHLVVPEGAESGACDVGSLEAVSGGRMRVSRIPFLPQTDFDRLLWSCDLNFVRGEDSWVRAIWAERPFMWQAYPQAESAHLPKLEAFLRLLTPGLLSDAIRWWNGAPGGCASALPALIADPKRDAAFRTLSVRQAHQPDLAGNLLAFAETCLEQNRAAATDGGKL
jgi:uncharacterized repeat protein (TIGR03837 family)